MVPFCKCTIESRDGSGAIGGVQYEMFLMQKLSQLGVVANLVNIKVEDDQFVIRALTTCKGFDNMCDFLMNV